MKFCDSARYLEVTIDADLKWRQQLENVSETSVCYLVRNQHVVDQEVLMQVYYECFHSIVKYGLIFWGNSPKAERFISLTKAHYSFELCAKNGKIIILHIVGLFSPVESTTDITCSFHPGDCYYGKEKARDVP